MSTPLAIIDAPSELGLRAGGVRDLATALRESGLLTGLEHDARRVRVDVPPRSRTRDPAWGVLDAAPIRRYTLALAAEVGRALDRGCFPLVLGGDCSILLGPMLALRRRGRHGLLFLDGHADFYSPDAEPNGEAASMDLALITGHGPALLTDIEGMRPLVREDDVVLLGHRDADDAARFGSPDVRDTAILTIDVDELRQRGIHHAMLAALERLAASRLDGFWIHLDADVLDDDVMPAVDYRMPGGLRPSELGDILHAALASRSAVGLDLTIYNPALDDAQRTAARTLAATVNDAFARADVGTLHSGQSGGTLAP